MNKIDTPYFYSNALLVLISTLSLYFLSGWPARMLLFGDTSGEGGLGLIIIAPFMMVLGLISIPITFAIVRRIFNYPRLAPQRVFLVGIITTAIGTLAFWIPVIMPGVIYQTRVVNFNVKPTLISQSLDQSTKTYNFSLQLDNKTDKTYEDVDVSIGTGFLFTRTAPPFVWTANHAKPHKLTINPGITAITDSIYLGDCKENVSLRDGSVKLELGLVYNPNNEGTTNKYTKKSYSFNPEIEGVDFSAYYKGICNWFSSD